MKKFILALISFAFVSFATVKADHHAGDHVPDSLIHVVTVSWKPDATAEQIQGALDAVKVLATEFDGITRVWTKTVKAQGDRTHAFVMEFTSEQALKDYAGSDAQKKWYESYIPYRARSTTFDITN